MTSVEIPATAKPPGPSLRVSVVLILVGIALAIPSFVAGVVPIVQVSSRSYRLAAPTVVRMQLDKGRYMVFEDIGSSGLFDSGGSTTLLPQNVEVTADDGTTIDVFSANGVRETRTSGGDRYLGAVEFTTPKAGEYTVRVNTLTEKSMLVARPLKDVIAKALVWFALAGLGGLVFVTGVVLLIVGSVRRNRARTAFAYTVPSPPGWHPDPGGSGHWRYWDGYRWTEHLQ